jgi:hypothetical protein
MYRLIGSIDVDLQLGIARADLHEFLRIAHFDQYGVRKFL